MLDAVKSLVKQYYSTPAITVALHAAQSRPLRFFLFDMLDRLFERLDKGLRLS